MACEIIMTFAIELFLIDEGIKSIEKTPWCLGKELLNS